MTIHDDAGIYYEPQSLLKLDAEGHISRYDSSDSGYEKQIKARASMLPYDVEIYTRFGSGNNEQALYEQAESDGYGKKEIVLEIDTNNQAIAIYGDKSIPLDDHAYQLASNAFNFTFTQELTPTADHESFSPLLEQDT